MRRNQNQVTMTLAGACPQTLTPRIIPLKKYIVRHRQHKELTLLITGGYEVGKIYYLIILGITKVNQLLLAMLVFPLLVANFTVKPSCKITIISRNTPFVILFLSLMVVVVRYFTPETIGFLVNSFWRLLFDISDE